MSTHGKRRIARRSLVWTAMLGAVLSSGVACSNNLFEPADRTSVGAIRAVQGIPIRSQADILFVIDDSGSMSGEQANLANNFAAFIIKVEEANDVRVARGIPAIDYRIAVTSTSVKARFLVEGEPLILDTFEGGADCTSNLPLGADTPYPAGDFLAARGNPSVLARNLLSRDEMIRLFQENARVGVCGSGQEQGLRAMALALEKHPDFLRDGSRLVVAFLSDEDDCSDPNDDAFAVVVSGGALVDQCVVEGARPDGGDLGPVRDYVDFLHELRADAVAGVIVGATRDSDGSVVAENCMDPDCAANCTASDPASAPCFCGSISPGNRYLEFASLLDGSLADSVCQSDFSGTLEDLALLIEEMPDRIALSERPHQDDPRFVRLKIHRGGSDITCRSPQDASVTCDGSTDWTYDPVDNALTLCEEADGGRCQLAEGDTFELAFVTEACSTPEPCEPAL